jgi:hypothetical protein
VPRTAEGQYHRDAALRTDSPEKRQQLRTVCMAQTVHNLLSRNKTYQQTHDDEEV